jgi:hypothetical protein
MKYFVSLTTDCEPYFLCHAHRRDARQLTGIGAHLVWGVGVTAHQLQARIGGDGCHGALADVAGGPLHDAVRVRRYHASCSVFGVGRIVLGCCGRAFDSRLLASSFRTRSPDWFVVCGSVARLAANWVARQRPTPSMTVTRVGMNSGDSTSAKIAMPIALSDMHHTMTALWCPPHRHGYPAPYLLAYLSSL